MILLVTPSERASEWAEALNEATGEKIMVTGSLAQATTFLRAESFLAVVLDQFLLEAEPDEAADTIEHMGTAIPVQVNLALTGMERLVREVRAAIKRRRREEVAARQAAVGKFQNELNTTVTALLLSVELAMESLGLPAAANERLESMHALVKKLRMQLESADMPA
ncbi:MAG: hypothetical protein LAO30_15735 [Acidobacteriia bacterium]|nr:hypothetical protein [Terriglobia bacterium]